MKPDKIFYYSDPLNDDFSPNEIKTEFVGRDFKYLRRSILWNGCARFLYYGIALPIVYLISKLYLGVKFENRKVLKKVRKKGVFLYGNHTRSLDAFLPPLAAFPRRAFIIANPDAVSIPFLRGIVQMLGAIPVPSEAHALKSFRAALCAHHRKRDLIAIYPEAHIWPFYTGIRPFSDVSFSYPVQENAPVVCMVTTYRRRRGLFCFCKKPGMTITFSEPMEPNASLSPREARKDLRDRAHEFMLFVSQTKENVEYVRYVYQPKEEEEEETERIG